MSSIALVVFVSIFGALSIQKTWNTTAIDVFAITKFQETNDNAADDTASTDIESETVKENRSTSSDNMISSEKNEHNHEKDDVNVLALYPNATAMQFNNDNRLFTDRKAKRFGSHALGSLCSQSQVKPAEKNQNIHGTHDECSQLSFPLSKGIYDSSEGNRKRVNHGLNRDLPHRHQNRRKRKETLNAPDECWPRLAIITSYPTGGSFMARMLFSISTGLATGQVGKTGFRETVYDWGNSNTFTLHGQCFCESNLQLPYAGRVALLKTHQGPRMHNIFIEDVKNSTSSDSTELVNEHDYQLPSHVVRLVRNPGDHLIRQASRWVNDEKNNNDFKDFTKRAKSQCQKLVNGEKKLDGFLIFHREWEKVSRHISSKLLHYEDITDPDIVGNKMAEVVDFLGETQRFDVKYTEVVRRPQYVHGTLFKEMCGVEMARELHNKTNWISDQTGYSFDWEYGVWSLRNN